MIKFAGVTKKFGKITALEKASFGVDKGEFVFLIGPSGSGKTTVVRLILREYLPTSGKITVGDFNLGDLSHQEIPLLIKSHFLQQQCSIFLNNTADHLLLRQHTES